MAGRRTRATAATTASGGAAAPPRGRPLSESVIWSWLRTYYERQGVEAWRSGAVPTFITTNAFIARAYAHVVAAHLHELHARGELDLQRPVHVVELGAGHGRFTYLVLRRLLRLLELRPVPGLHLRYVMTDLAERNLEFQAGHPMLRELFDRGVLDQATFDCETDTELVLRRAGERLGPGDAANPVVVIANYVFDSLRQDVFRINQGVLEESLAIVAGEDGEPDWSDPQVLEKIQISYEHVKVASGRYDDPALDDVLTLYARELSDSSFLVPVGALSCLGRLRALSGGRMLVLSADKGYNHLREMLWHGDPRPVGHGSFSLSVNYHAIGEYVRRIGGRALHSSPRDASLSIAAFVLDGQAEQDAPAAAGGGTELAFEEHVETFGPIDFFILQGGLARVAGDLTVAEILAALRMSDFDPRVLGEVCRPLTELMEKASDDERRDVRRAVARCWDNYFPLGEARDLPFDLGRLHTRAGFHRDALRYYRLSVDLFGEDSATYHNMGLAWNTLGDRDEALGAFERALALDPGSSAARSWRLRLLADPAPG